VASCVFAVFVGASGLVSTVVIGQQAETPRFRTGVQTVQVTVTVTDENGRLITGLSKDDFEIFEDGAAQEVTQFTAERVPVSLGVMLDASDSMRGEAIADARGAVDRFVGELLQEDDEAFVATFNHDPRMASTWKMPPALLTHILDPLRPSGGTALYDAMVALAPLFERRVHNRAALVIISDGADTASDRTLQQAREVIRRTDAFVYAVAIDPPDAPDRTRVNPEALREITGPSGGYTEVVHGPDDLGPATERIADELNHQYTLGYSSSHPPDGGWRGIRVRVPNHDYFARSRRGYFSERLPS
jgi:Ca-activated chloride channel family protein